MFKSALHDLIVEQHRGVIPWLDLMRSLAVLLVIGGHTIEFGFGGLAAKAFYWGWTGVDLFFILSGYLIGLQLWKERQRTGTINFPRFVVRRTLRIWPLYFTFIGGYLVWDVLAHHSLAGLWADCLFVSNYLHAQVKGGWSLSTEEQFYLALPLLLLIFRRVRNSRLIVLPLAWMLLLPFFRAERLDSNPTLTAGDLIYTPFHTHSDALAIGVIIALMATTWPFLLKTRTIACTLAAAMIVAGVVAHATAYTVLSYTSLALIYGGLVILGLYSTLTNQLTSWRGFHVISRLSFGMYLNHLIIIEAVESHIQSFVTPRAVSPVWFGFAFAAVVAASMLAAFVTFALVERPFLALRDRVLAKPVQPEAEPVRPRAAAASA